MNRATAGLLLLASAAAATAADDVPTAVGRRIEDLSWGAVEIRLEAEPSRVRLDRDLLVTITVSWPSQRTVTLPDLRDRFGGFVTAEGFSRDPVAGRERTSQVHQWRLTPEPGRKYRLAPFAVEVRDASRQPPEVSWFATRPVVFPAADLGAPPSGDVEAAVRPRWIPPAGRTVAGWIGAGAAMAAALGLILLGLRRLKRVVRERRMSPRERALAELDRLLRRNLVGRGNYKDFYIELTMVVRRYIEREHGVRAPEQTTPEFLEAAARHPRFPAAVLARLRVFLESADLVKFACATATPQAAGEAVQAARRYIEA